MAQRPTNHATRLQRDRVEHEAVKAETIPDVPQDLLEHLEKEFPEKCYAPSEESLENHLMYAGGVLMVAFLRRAYTLQNERPDAELDEAEE